MKRNDYRRRLKEMSDENLLDYIDKKTDFVLAGGDELNRLVYAKDLAKKRGLIKKTA